MTTRDRSDLTNIQREVLEYLQRFMRDHDRMPSGSEIARKFGYRSTTSAYRHIERLVQAGYLEEGGGRTGSKTWRLTPAAAPASSIASLPVMGQIPAGPFDEAMEESDGLAVNIEDAFAGLRPGDQFVDVDSDIPDAGLNAGDRVVVRTEQGVAENALAAVSVEDSTPRLRYVTVRPDHILLREQQDDPESACARHPIGSVRIIGPVVAVLTVQLFRQSAN